jgi:hypothetical protein
MTTCKYVLDRAGHLCGADVTPIDDRYACTLGHVRTAADHKLFTAIDELVLVLIPTPKGSR